MELPPSLVIDFDPPITWNGKSIPSIELREPKASEVVKAQAELTGKPEATVKYGMALIGAVSGENRQVIEQMPISKLMAGIEYLLGFLKGGPEDGES